MLLTPFLHERVRFDSGGDPRDSRLGKGSYGEVRKGRLLTSGQIVAVKTFRADAPWWSISQEIKALVSLRHQHVVTLHFVARTPGGDPALVMECLDSSVRDLYNGIRDKVDRREVFRGHIQEEQVKSAMQQILRAVDHMHSQCWAHLDIHPGNILVSSAGDVKLTDFGMATSTDPCNNPNVIAAWYRPPEVARCEYHPRSEYYPAVADMWSVGCVLAEMLFGKPLFSARNDAELLSMHQEYRHDRDAYIQKTYYDKQRNVPDVSPRALDLMMRLVNCSTNARLTAQQALEDAWLAAYWPLDLGELLTVGPWSRLGVCTSGRDRDPPF